MSKEKRERIIERFNANFQQAVDLEFNTFEALLHLSDEEVDFLKTTTIRGGYIEQKQPWHLHQLIVIYATYQNDMHTINCGWRHAAFLSNRDDEEILFLQDEEMEFLERVLRKSGVKQFLLDLVEAEKEPETKGYTNLGADTWQFDEEEEVEC